MKDLSYLKIKSVNRLHFLIKKSNGYIEASTGNKYLTLVPTDENKDTLKKYEELWNNLRDLNRSKNNNLDNYDEKYMKAKFNSIDDLPLKIC